MDTWTIKKVNGKFQPKHNGIEVGIAHNTENDARVFIACQIASNSPEAKKLNFEWKNKAYRDFDLC